MKSLIITGPFVCITVAQLALGIYLTNLAASAPPQRFPPINLPEYQLCLFTRHPKVEIAYTAMSLIYDVLAFVVIAVLAVRSAGRDFKMPHLLRAIVQDSTVYFLVIFTSHFVLELMLLLARPSLQLLPAIGNVVYLPLMINRLMLSLRKTANPPDAGGWSLTSVIYASKHSCNVDFAPMSDEDTAFPIEEGFALQSSHL